MPLEICKHYESKDLAGNITEGESGLSTPLKMQS
jgi:hypothetical protein